VSLLTGRENSGLVNDRGLVDLLVNGDGGVNGLVGVSLSLDNRGYVLVNWRWEGGWEEGSAR